MNSQEEKHTNIIGTVINIQHYCYHDGPGVRTTVFLKGCSLHCKWCANPESINPKQELSYDPRECIGCKGCGLCLKSPFPEGAFTELESGGIKVNWDLTNGIGETEVSACPANAIFLQGERKTVDEVLDEVLQDFNFYQNSNGGITLSGGEPLLQPDFSEALLIKSHKNGFSTAIETAGNVPWENIQKVIPHVDTVIHDIKIMDADKHKKWTGVNNQLILENFKKAYQQFPDTDFLVRTPIISEINDDEENILAVLEFIRPYPNVIGYELMPYHKLGTGKYKIIGKDYEMDEYNAPSDERIQYLRDIIDDFFENRF